MKIKFEIIQGCEGSCLTMNDTRIAGAKPWGGGRVEHTFNVGLQEIEKIISAIQIKEGLLQQVSLLDSQFPNVMTDLENITIRKVDL